MLLLITVSFYLLIHCAVPQGCPGSVKNNPNPPSSFAFGSHTSSSVVLSWSPTITVNCIKNYNIMSNTSNPDMTTTATQATLSVMNNNEPPTAKYCAIVATISTSNKMSLYSEPVCFILDVPAFILLTYEWIGANLTLNWMSNQDDRPQITAYYLSLFDAFSKQVLLSLTLSGDSTTTTISDSMLQNSNVVTVSLIAANALGNNTGSQVNVTLLSGSMSSSLLSLTLLSPSSSSLSSSLSFVLPSSTTISTEMSTSFPQPPSPTTVPLPNSITASTESKASVTTSTTGILTTSSHQPSPSSTTVPLPSITSLSESLTSVPISTTGMSTTQLPSSTTVVPLPSITASTESKTSVTTSTTGIPSTSSHQPSPSSTTVPLPSITSLSESLTSVTISTSVSTNTGLKTTTSGSSVVSHIIISTMTTKLTSLSGSTSLTHGGLASITSSTSTSSSLLTTTTPFLTNSSLADKLTSTAFLYESVSPGSSIVGPVVGGIVPPFLLIILIVSIIVTIVFVCRVKKISKTYSLKDEAVITNAVHIYDDVCEIEFDKQPEVTTQRELTSDYQEPGSIIRKPAISTGSLYTVHQRKAAAVANYADLSFPNNAASRQPNDVKQPDHDYDDIGRFSSSFNSPDRVVYSETTFQTILASSLPPPNLNLPEDNYSDMPGRINYDTSEEPPNMNHDDKDYDDII